MIFLSGSYFAVFWCIIRPDGLVRGCGVGEARGRVSKKKEKQRKKQKKKLNKNESKKGKKEKKGNYLSSRPKNRPMYVLIKNVCSSVPSERHQLTLVLSTTEPY